MAIELHDQGFLSRIREQYERIARMPGLSDSDRQQYHWDSAAAARKGKAECSLVTNVEHAAPGTSFGHMVEVPGFGRVSLAELMVDRGFRFRLNMLKMQLDDPTDGNPTGPTVMTNGHGGTGG